ncbi:MAG: ribonuclease H-like domain-containing protein [Verrucomicrobiota bacterium]
MAARRTNYVYFDLETQKSAAEVGGWHNKREMRMSLGVTYSTARGGYAIYLEDDADALITELQRADFVVGFNVINFDYEVLMRYAFFDFRDTPTIDLLDDVEASIGKRIKLDAIAKETLGVGKTADGMEALKWFKQGRLHEIAEYCCFDVKTTMLVHEYGARHGQLFYKDERTQRREAFPVDWQADGD